MVLKIAVFSITPGYDDGTEDKDDGDVKEDEDDDDDTDEDYKKYEDDDDHDVRDDFLSDKHAVWVLSSKNVYIYVSW